MAQRRPRSSSPFGIDSSTLDDYAKRPVAMNGITSTIVESNNNDFICPICYEIIKDAHITRCGHTFCYQCIFKSIDRYKRCPKCSTATTREQIFPNLLLDELITKYKTKMQQNLSINRPTSNTPTGDNLKKYILSESKNLTLPDINQMLEILTNQKQRLETETSTAQNCLLHEFLKHLLKHKELQKTEIIREINLVKKDLETVEKNALAKSSNELDGPNIIFRPTPIAQTSTDSSAMYTSFDNKNFETDLSDSYLRLLQMHDHLNDFISSYFSMRSVGVKNETAGSSRPADTDDKMRGLKYQQNNSLETFRDNLVKCSRYSTLKCKATMNYSSDAYVTSNIVSSIVFNKDNDHFAIGGVTKRIKIYNLSSIENDNTDFHYPVTEMVLANKISCLAWNAFYRNILASSDYEGVVNIWDVDTRIRTKCFHEHEKRCWSVDFNEIDTNLIVSGSDDTRVKLWSIKDNHSIATLEAKANVCCVKFNPKSSCHLAFGSADHYVHYYDLRNMKNALCIFKGHKKAVSYVKFLNSTEIVSASTDSQLKLWDINAPPLSLRSFKGHINEKNFVGLTTDRDYIACGSEDNSVYLYYKGMPKQLFSYKIDVPERASDLERLNDKNEFVSAVCWRKQSDIILVANSRGLIKALELV